MASIPLPALAVRPPEQTDPLESYGRIVQLKNLLAQQQLLPVQLQNEQAALQTHNLQNQQLQRQIDDNAAITKAIRDAQGDPDSALKLAAQGGVSGQGFVGFANSVRQLKMSSLQLTEAQRNEALQRMDAFKGAYDMVEKAKPEDRPAAYQQALQGLQQAQVDVSQLPQQYPGDDKFSGFGPTLQLYSKVLEQTGKQAEITKNTAQAAEATSATAKNQAETKNLQEGANSAVADSRYRNILMAQKQGKPVSQEDLAFKSAYERQKTLVPAFNFNIQQGDIANAGNPQTQALAQAVASGKMSIGDVITYRTPLAARTAFLNQVMQINPQFNAANFDIQKGVMKDFTSGKAAQNLTAFNTAIEHAKQLGDAADALNNGDVRGLNRIGNALGYQFGSDRTTNFNVIKNALAGEISKVFKGANATDVEIKEVSQPFSDANSPAQLKGAVQNAIRLMNSKRDALKSQYQSGIQGQPNFGEQPTQGGKEIHYKIVNGQLVAQ